jgi:hypothetical protein
MHTRPPCAFLSNGQMTFATGSCVQVMVDNERWVPADVAHEFQVSKVGGIGWRDRLAYTRDLMRHFRCCDPIVFLFVKSNPSELIGLCREQNSEPTLRHENRLKRCT